MAERAAGAESGRLPASARPAATRGARPRPGRRCHRGASAALLLLCATLALAAPARAEHAFAFASASEGRALLSVRDEYVEAMGPHDRALRLRAGGEISETEYLAAIARSVLEWDSEEKRAIQCALERIGPALSRLFTPLREPIHLVKTQGKEEFDSAYTRGKTIVLPTRVLGSVLGNPWGLRRLIAHEFFHVFSRHNPKLRNALYGAIGFLPCGTVEIPDALRPRTLTNPDAPRNEHCIRVELSGKAVWGVPIVQPPRRGAGGWDMSGLLVPSLLLVEKDGRSGVARPIAGGERSHLIRVDRVTGFFEQIGRNTSYIIHPEEIIAENASLLVMGARNFPSPEILTRIERLLEAARAGDRPPGQSARQEAPAPSCAGAG